MGKQGEKNVFRGESVFTEFLKKPRVLFPEIHKYTNIYLRKMLEYSEYPKEIIQSGKDLISVNLLKKIIDEINRKALYPVYFFKTKRSDGKPNTTYAPMLSHTMAMLLLKEIQEYLPLWYVMDQLDMNEDEYKNFIGYIRRGKPKSNSVFNIWKEGQKHNIAMRHFFNQNEQANEEEIEAGKDEEVGYIGWRANTVLKSEYLYPLMRAAEFYKTKRNNELSDDEDELRRLLGIRTPYEPDKYPWPPRYAEESVVLELAWEDFAIDRIPLSILRNGTGDNGSIHYTIYQGTVIKYTCYSTVIDDGRVVVINYPSGDENEDENCYHGTTIICFTEKINAKLPTIRSAYWKFTDAEYSEDIPDLDRKIFKSRQLQYAHWIDNRKLKEE